MKPPAQRKAEQRQRLREEGFKAYEIWVRPSQWPLVKRYIERLKKRG